VEDALQMSGAPLQIVRRRRLMSGVPADGCVTLRQSVRHVAIRRDVAVAAVPGNDDLAVPIRGNPGLEIHQRVVRCGDVSLHTAERWNAGHRPTRTCWPEA